MMHAINLRSDLATLSDAELAARLEAAWQSHEAAERRFPWSTWWPGSPPPRGPIRHPRIYRSFAAFSQSDGSVIALLVAILLGSKKAERLVRADRASDIYLSVCEIQDLTEELERRIDNRRQVQT